MRLPPLLKKRELTVPTVWGWLALLLLSSVVLFSALRFSHSFLAITRPVGGGIMVIEGWIPDDALKAATEYFQRESYSTIVVTGGPLESGSFLKEYADYSKLGAATLRKLGVPDSSLISVPAPYVSRDRTLTSAMVFKHWLDSTGYKCTKLDLYSFDAHSRRSAMLFRRALGKEVRVGVVALPDFSYDSRNWWKTSSGFRMVVGEMIAYVYAFLIRF